MLPPIAAEGHGQGDSGNLSGIYADGPMSCRTRSRGAQSLGPLRESHEICIQYFAAWTCDSGKVRVFRPSEDTT